MRLFAPSLLALLLALSPAGLPAQGAPTAQVQTYGLRIEGRAVEVLFRVTERATGRDVAGLTASDITLLEDDAPIAGPVELREERSGLGDARLVELGPGAVSGSAPLELGAAGATIGVVYDASQLTNAPGDATDYVRLGRELIEAFLEAGRAVAPSNPEALGLFFPLSVPGATGETIRPAALSDFTQDRNAAINSLRQQPPRAGRTNVFDTLAVAIGATADEARRRGTDAHVLLVTDGGDVASLGSYDALVAEARANRVRLLILGVGPDARLAANSPALTTLADQSGGMFLGNPATADVQALYTRLVQPTEQRGYVLRYTTGLIDDGKLHRLVIQVSGPVTGMSSALQIAPGQTTGTPATIALGPAMRAYALRAIPVAIITSLLFSLALVLLQRLFGDRSRSISGGVTRQ